MIKRSMTVEPEKIPFQKLTPEEVTNLLNEMAQSPPDIVASLSQENPQRFRIQKIEKMPAAKIYVDGAPKTAGDYLLNFGLKSGVYFLKSRGQISERGYCLDFSGDIFKIQRRENFRCPIPSQVASTVRVYSSEDSAPLSGEYQLRNLSGQGVAINLPENADLKVWRKSAEVFLDLQILSLSLTKMKAVIRHVHTGPDTWAGLEFPGLNFTKETDLSSLSLQLQRILFQAHSERSS